MAGLLELADLEFTGIREDLRIYADKVRQQVGDGQNTEINAPSIEALIGSSDLLSRADSAIAAMYGCPLGASSLHYARNRAEELLKIGFKTTDEIVIALSRGFEAITHFAADWLAQPSADERELRDNMDENGKWKSLPHGISLFYLWLYRRASIETVEEIAAKWRMTGSPSDAHDLIALREKADREWQTTPEEHPSE